MFRLHIVRNGREAKYPDNGAGESLQGTTHKKKKFYVTCQYNMHEKEKKEKEKKKKKEVALYWSLRMQWKMC